MCLAETGNNMICNTPIIDFRGSFLGMSQLRVSSSAKGLLVSVLGLLAESLVCQAGCTMWGDRAARGSDLSAHRVIVRHCRGPGSCRGLIHVCR